jgi:hypothetical protein
VRSRFRKAGYRYALSILQAESSLTQVLDRPVHGRQFFEESSGAISKNFSANDPSPLEPMTHQLRCLRLHGLIQRIPKTHRYQATDLGFRAGLFFSKVYSRILRPGLAFALPDVVATDSRLRRAFRAVISEVENWIENAKLVAA